MSSNSFFQVNRFLLDRLVEAALDGLEGETALDLYAGVGLFSLPLARRFRRGDGGGIGRRARCAICSSTRSAPGWRICRCEQRTAEELPDAAARRRRISCCSIRRAPGSARRWWSGCSALRPPRITIVACDPATLARDLAGLLARRLRDRADDAGRSVPADVSPGDGGAAGLEE